jgi:hypothetical protein
MRRPTLPAFLIPFLLLLSSCAPGPRIAWNRPFLEKEAGKNPWRKVAVLPLAGEPELRRPAAEWIAFRLRSSGRFEVVGPSLAEIRLAGSGGAAGTGERDSRKAGVALGVDGVVAPAFGIDPSTSFPATELSATLIDASSGSVVATCSRMQPLRGSRYPPEDTLDLLLRDCSPAFDALSGMPWKPPADGEDPRGKEMPQ